MTRTQEYTTHLIMTLAMLMIAAPLAFALSQPTQPDDPFGDMPLTLSSLPGTSGLPDMDIHPSSLSIAGSACSALYSTTNEYCSGHIRIYYQCLDTIEGPEYQQRTENCAEYPGGGICVQDGSKARCESYTGTTSYGKKLLMTGIGLIAGGILLMILAPLLFKIGGMALILLGLYYLLKLWLGGV